MTTNQVPMHPWDHADMEHVLYVGRWGRLQGSQSYWSHTYSHKNIQLYILVHISGSGITCMGF